MILHEARVVMDAGEEAAIRQLNGGVMPRDERRRLLVIWHRSNGICYYCAMSTELPERGSKCGCKENTATRDHVYSKKNRKRNRRNGGYIVLSCYSCNQLKNAIEFGVAKDAEMKHKMKALEQLVADMDGKGHKKPEQPAPPKETKPRDKYQHLEKEKLRAVKPYRKMVKASLIKERDQ